MPYPWQTEQWNTLWAARQQGRLPHALLLSGVRGLGKARFAEELAQAVLCEKGGEIACQMCRSCHLFSTGAHPDYFSIGLLEKSKSIKIDQIRDLSEALHKKTQYKGHQVAVIYPAESMNRAASNALLKTLEEPAGDVLLILVSDQFGGLPATVMSRCQMIRFTCSETDEVLTWLSRQLPTHVSATQCLKWADYAPLQALSLAQDDYASLRDKLLGHLSQVLMQGANPIAPVSDFLKQDLNALLRAFISILRDLLCLRLGVASTAIINSDQLSQLQSMVALVSVASLVHVLDQLQEAQQRLSGVVSVNLQLLLENLFITWMGLKTTR